MTLRSRFDGRQVVSRHLQSGPREEGVRLEVAGDEVPLRSMVIGLDPPGGRALSRDEVQGFGDYFTVNLLLRDVVPLTLGGLATALEGGGLAVRDVFVIAEGAAFSAGATALDLNTRLVIVWRKDDASKPDVMASTVAAPDDPTALLQVIAWSEEQGAFHYFERSRDGAGWMWAGHSFHALKTPTRGRGPFDSHVNGSLVMKELKEPWVHWHSQSDGIPRPVVLPTPELRGHPLFADISGAENLESIVRNGIVRWTGRRLKTETADGTLEHFKRFARQIVTTTSVNLVSSKLSRDGLETADAVDLPVTFFLDVDGLERALSSLDPGGGGIDAPAVVVPGETYRAALAELGSHLVDGNGHRVDGDGHFAFIVPERAFEDTHVIAELLRRGLCSARLVLSLLLLDFANPIFSTARERFLDCFPDSVAVAGGAAVDDKVVAAVNDTLPASLRDDFRRWWDAPDLAGSARQAVTAYLATVNARLATQEGTGDVLRLAESRRDRIRRRPLLEFKHTMPALDRPVGSLIMRPDGTVVPADH